MTHPAKTTKMVVANFKTQVSYASSKAYIKSLSTLLAAGGKKKEASFDNIVICPPFPYLHLFKESDLLSHNIKLGAQDCSSCAGLPLTGDITPSMLKDFQVSHVVLGHSERLLHLKEAKRLIKKKVETALHAGLTPILCVGEPSWVKEAGTTDAYLTNQLTAMLPATCSKITLAYEPLWAVGTGKTPDPSTLESVLKHLRHYATLRGMTCTLLYGGSVDAKNCGAFFNLEELDGVLVGKASLKPDALLAMARQGRL